MKATIKNVIATSLILGSLNGYTTAGDGAGNGGVSVATQVSAIATNVLTLWEDACQNDKDVSAKRICKYTHDYSMLLNKRSRNFVKILEKKETQAYDNNSRSATNNERDIIEMDVEHWNGLIEEAEGQEKRVKLVLHEYLSIIGLDTSDYYGGSNEVYSILKNMGYTDKTISTTNGLPGNCSAAVRNSFQADNSELMKKLKNTGFKIKDRAQRSRYDLIMSSTCKDKTFTNTCSSYLLIKDNFKDTTVYEKMVIDSSSKKVEKLLKRVIKAVSSEVSSCSEDRISKSIK